MRLATREDGTPWHKWKKQKIAILTRGPPGSFDEKYIEGQQILKFGLDYVLLYHAFNGVRWTEGLAYSQNLRRPFTKSEKNPVFGGGVPGTWDEMHVSTSYLYQLNNRWYLFYQGTNNPGFYSFANWDLGMAELH